MSQEVQQVMGRSGSAGRGFAARWGQGFGRSPLAVPPARP